MLTRVVRSKFVASAGKRLERSISSDAVPVTVAHGDGIGPEIMESTLAVLKAAGANMKVSYLSSPRSCLIINN
jgi:hypothetical protein